MPRTTPPDRLEHLLAAAATEFVRHGFQCTQMDDIATRLEVSKGTIYRSVDSKDALLAAVLEYADSPDRLPESGPIEAAGMSQVAATLRRRLSRAATDLELTRAAASPDPELTDTTFGDEVERLALDAFSMMSAHRVRIMVLDRCAAEIPELAGDWYESGRYALVDLWAEYLAQRAQHVTESVDRDVLARTIVELLTLWAVKMPWDPAPRPYAADADRSCATMIRNLVTGRRS